MSFWVGSTIVFVVSVFEEKAFIFVTLNGSLREANSRYLSEANRQGVLALTFTDVWLNNEWDSEMAGVGLHLEERIRHRREISNTFQTQNSTLYTFFLGLCNTSV
jgi:hypothetical protein